MKVLITHELFMPDYAGGGETIVYELAKGLRRRGVDVTVLTTGDPAMTEYEGIPTVRLKMNRYMMNFASVKKYAKDADIIQANNYNGCLASYRAAKSLGKPVICLVHGMYGSKWLGMRGPVLGRISRWVEKFQVDRDYDKIVFYSEFARDAGVDIGIPKENTTVILPGVEYGKFHVGKKRNHVLFVGRLAKQKGLDVLIEAARQLPDITFNIVGRGEEESHLKSIAPPNVEFLGFKSGKPLYDLYAEAGVFCLPSMGETFGLVILEAMASGCAVVSTVPVDYAGKHVPYGDVAQLKNAIRYYHDNPEAAARDGAENRKLAKNYSWDKFADGFIKLYKELLG